MRILILCAALALAPAAKADVTTCDAVYTYTADMLGQAEDAHDKLNDPIVDSIHYMRQIVRMKIPGAAIGLHCTPFEVEQLTDIISVLLLKGWAAPPDELAAQQRKRDADAWNAAVAKFNQDVQALKDTK